MSYKVLWGKTAEADLNEIIEYIIGKGEIDNAYAVFTKIKKRAELLQVSPGQGRIVPEFKSLHFKYREIIISPWRIIYKIDKPVVKVLMVIDGRRNTEDLLYEKLIKVDRPD